MTEKPRKICEICGIVHEEPLFSLLKKTPSRYETGRCDSCGRYLVTTEIDSMHLCVICYTDRLMNVYGNRLPKGGENGS